MWTMNFPLLEKSKKTFAGSALRRGARGGKPDTRCVRKVNKTLKVNCPPMYTR